MRTTKTEGAARPRVAIVVSHPIQHFCPMYREIANDSRVELLVIFAETGAEARFDAGFGRAVQWQADIMDGFASVVVKASEKQRPAAVIEELRKFSPDVLYVHGYAKDYLRKAMQWARKAKVPVIMTTDSELKHARPWHVRVVKSLVLPRILRDVTLFLTVGDENERYFEHYGVSRERMHRVPFSIDSSFYDKVLAEHTQKRDEVRRRLNLASDAVVILTVGKLIPRKRQIDLMRAMELMRTTASRAVLLVVGDGPDRKELEEVAHRVGDAVRLVGFIGVDELPEFYVASDVYVHPSDHDPHPLAISEALYCGLPVVVSDRIGSAGATDDVQEGRNGWVYPVGDETKLAELLAMLVNDATLRQSAGKESLELGQLHAAKNVAARFVDGALLALVLKAK